MARKKKTKVSGLQSDDQGNQITAKQNMESTTEFSPTLPVQHQSLKDDTLQQPPTKKAKRNHARPSPSAEFAPSSLPNEVITARKGSEDSSKQSSMELPSEVQHLAPKYDLTPMSIISSSKMEHKIRNVLERINKFSFTDVAGKPGVVILHAQAKDASKLITVAEIAKREVEKEKGKWWQYTKLEGQIMEMKSRTAKSQTEPSGKTIAMWEAEQQKGASRDTDFDVELTESLAQQNTDDQQGGLGGVSLHHGRDDGEEDEEELFETMIVPATDPRMPKVSENARKKVRAIPIITIFLARVPIPGLKEIYGEQTNSPTT